MSEHQNVCIPCSMISILEYFSDKLHDFVDVFLPQIVSTCHEKSITKEMRVENKTILHQTEVLTYTSS